MADTHKIELTEEELVDVHYAVTLAIDVLEKATLTHPKTKEAIEMAGVLSSIKKVHSRMEKEYF